MKMNIPNDWAEEWECVTIIWPKSTKWRSILAGLIYSPSKGRFWAENSGTIVEAQTIGREIWERNSPFVNCEGQEISEPIIIYQGQGSAGDDDMSGQVVTEVTFDPVTRVLTVEYGKCCVEEYDLNGAGTIKPEIDGDPDVDIEEPTGGWSACGKAASVMQMYRGVMESIWDEREAIFPMSAMNNVFKDNPGVGMDGKWILAALLGASMAFGVISEPGSDYAPEPFDETTWQSALCKLAVWFTDSEGPEYSGNDIRNKVQSIFAGEFGLDVLMIAMFDDGASAINRVEWENAATLGAAIENQDCDCPEAYEQDGESEPTNNGWYLGVVNEVTVTKSGYNTPVCIKVIPNHDAYGCCFAFEWTSPGGGDLGRSAGGCQNYDIQAWGDTSDQWENEEPQTMIAAINQSVAEEIFGVGVNLSTCSYQTDQIASPTANPGEVIAHGFNMNAMEDGTTYTVRFRLIHNIYSPSHGA